MKEGRLSKCALVVEVDLLVGEGFELGSSLYGAVAGDRLGGSSSGSAIQFGAVMRPRTPGRLPEQRVRWSSTCTRSPRPDGGRSRPQPASSPACGRGGRGNARGRGGSRDGGWRCGPLRRA